MRKKNYFQIIDILKKGIILNNRQEKKDFIYYTSIYFHCITFLFYHSISDCLLQ